MEAEIKKTNELVENPNIQSKQVETLELCSTELGFEMQKTDDVMYEALMLRIFNAMKTLLSRQSSYSKKLAEQSTYDAFNSVYPETNDTAPSNYNFLKP